MPGPAPGPSNALGKRLIDFPKITIFLNLRGLRKEWWYAGFFRWSGWSGHCMHLGFSLLLKEEWLGRWKATRLWSRLDTAPIAFCRTVTWAVLPCSATLQHMRFRANVSNPKLFFLYCQALHKVYHECILKLDKARIRFICRSDHASPSRSNHPQLTHSPLQMKCLYFPNIWSPHPTGTTKNDLRNPQNKSTPIGPPLGRLTNIQNETTPQI